MRGGRSLNLRLACFVGALAWIGSVGTIVPRAAEPQSRAGTRTPPDRAAQAAQPAPSPAVVGTVVKDYCAACHNERTKTGGLVLTNLDPANVPADAEVWEKVIRKVRTGMMPPLGVRHPDPTDARRVRLARSRPRSIARRPPSPIPDVRPSTA